MTRRRKAPPPSRSRESVRYAGVDEFFTAMRDHSRQRAIVEFRKPCPFCGGQAGMKIGDTGQGYVAICGCPTCKAVGPVSDSPDPLAALLSALDKWNAAPRLQRVENREDDE